MSSNVNYTCDSTKCTQKAKNCDKKNQPQQQDNSGLPEPLPM